MGDNSIYPLVNVYIAMGRCTIFNRNAHYKWAMFNSVNLLEKNCYIIYMYYNLGYRSYDKSY